MWPKPVKVLGTWKPNEYTGNEIRTLCNEHATGREANDSTLLQIAVIAILSVMCAEQNGTIQNCAKVSEREKADA